MKNNLKYVILVITIFLLLMAPLAVLKNPLFLGFNGLGSYINYIQRVGGLMAFILLVNQILLGTIRFVFGQKTPSWIGKMHIYYGFLTAGLVLLHPISLLLVNFIYRKIIDPFYVFTDFCLLCDPKKELFVTFGRVAFWLLGLVFIAAMLRKQNWWRDNWKYIHYSAYLIFFLIAIHAYKIGSDVHTKTFLPVYWGGVILVLISLLTLCIITVFKKTSTMSRMN